MKKTNGFSLMETMIVLLIVSVIVAASAPMINKKMVSAASDKSPWVWVDGKNIAYNLRNENLTASIGDIRPNTGARLHISTKYDKKDKIDKPQMSLRYYDTFNKRINWRLFANDTSLNLSTSVVTPDNSVVIGAVKDGIARSSVVIGNGAKGGSEDVGGSVAIGANTFTGGNSITIGNGATINGSQSIALGSSYDNIEEITYINGNNSIAIGFNSKVKAVDGHRTESSVSNSTAIGAGSQVSAENSTALGASSQAQGSNSIAIGYEAKVPTLTWKGQTIDRTSATAIGAFAEAAGNYSIALGGGIDGNANTQTKAGGNSSIAIGRGAESKEAGTIAIGRASVSNGSKAIAIGSKTDDSNSTGAEAVGDSSIAIGSRAYAEDGYSIAIGGGSGGNANTQTKAGGNSSIAIGRGAESTEASTIAIGRASEAKASGAIAIGSKIDDTTSKSATATALNAIAIGHGASATHDNSVAIGHNSKANHNNQITLGNESSIVYIPGNLIVKGNSYLSVGEGKHSYIKVYRDDHLDSRYLVRLQYDGNFWPNVGDPIEVGSELIQEDDGYNSTIEALFTDFSDRRLKDVGKAFKGGLEEIKKLEVFNYTFKKDKSKTPRVGVMAQDLEKIFPNAVFKGEDGFLRIRMEDIFYAMVNAIKELDSKINILEQKQKKIDELESKVTKLEKRLADLEKKIK